MTSDKTSIGLPRTAAIPGWRGIVLLPVLLLCLFQISVADTPAPDPFVLADFPLIKQQPDLCGPACLSAMLLYYSISYDQKQIAAWTGMQKTGASNGADLLLFARAAGLKSYSWNSSIDDAAKKLEKGAPVLLLLDSRKAGHYVVLIGCDAAKQTYIVMDPAQGKEVTMTRSELNSRWYGHGYWAMVVVAPTKDTFEKELSYRNPVFWVDMTAAYAHRGMTREANICAKNARIAAKNNPAVNELLFQATQATGSGR